MALPTDGTLVVAVDFDRTLHSHTSGNTAEIVDRPIPGAIDFVNLLVDAGHRVIIHTVRKSPGPAAVAGWLRDEGVKGPITVAAQKPDAHVFLDDRALRFEGVYPSLEELRKAARPWNS